MGARKKLQRAVLLLESQLILAMIRLNETYLFNIMLMATVVIFDAFLTHLSKPFFDNNFMLPEEKGIKSI